MSPRRARSAGFTLIELMIVVAIIGILAALAIPAFVGYIRRSKTAEATTNVRNLFSGAASYYQTENWGRGLVAAGGTSVALVHCTVADAQTTNTPGVSKTQLNFDTVEAQTFRSVGFSIADPVYYRYHVMNSTNQCGNMVGTPQYTFQAQGDLDGDGVLSTFELGAGSDASNNLMRAPGYYITNELE